MRALMLVLALLGSGCAGRGPSPNLVGPAREVLVVANSNDAISLDPAVGYEFTSTAIDLNVYDTLIRYENTDYTKPLPNLARRWTVTPDGLAYRFFLRPGLRFASGSPLDAAAVVFSLRRTLALGMAPAELLSDCVEAAPGAIRAVDPRTVEIRLKHPASYFLSILFNPAAAVVDPAVVVAHEVDGDRATGWLRDHSAGSGPFVLERWERDIAIVLARNDRYWGTLPRLRRVIIKDVKESTTQKMMLERGDVDMAYDLNPLQIEDAVARARPPAAPQASSRVRALEVPFLRLYYLGMNVTHPPLGDVRVRRAIRAAIDYEGMMALGRGHAVHLEGPVIKGLLGYAPRLGVRHDVERARALLREAGYPDGFEVEMALSGGPTQFGPTREDMAVKLQADLAKVGIRASVRALSSTAYLDLYRAHKTQLNFGDWGADYPDPHNFAHPFGHSQGSLARRVQYDETALDPLIEAAGREPSPRRREALYLEVQRRLMRDGPWAILLQPTRLLPIRAEVHGYRYDAQSPMDYRALWKAPPTAGGAG